MLIHPPCCITSRLCAGLKIGDLTISIEYSDREGRDGRTRYRYYLDCGERSYEADDLQSGRQGGSLQGGLESLLAFLGAAGEAYEYWRSSGMAEENSDLFPAWVNEWAYQNEDELSLLACEAEEEGTEWIDEN